jgi:pimeloyl-ACP methyl ester carboxylesterase
MNKVRSWHSHLPGFFVACLALPAFAGSTGEQAIDTIDHYVLQRSKVPSIEGQFTQLYVRERVLPATIDSSKDLERRVVLFVHGRQMPSEIVFDLPYEDYSWMAFLATNGFDAFAVDMTGYGRSTRPNAMNDPCNLSEENRQEIGMDLEPCEPSYEFRITTMASDWADIGRAVDYIRELRQVSKVSLIASSAGGRIAGGYAAQNPDKVDRMVLDAPAYRRTLTSGPPSKPVKETAMLAYTEAMQSQDWDRQIGCPDQYDPEVRKMVWLEAVKLDPVGATWGSGAVRYPRTINWGWNQEMVSRTNTPTLLLSGEYDKGVTPDRVFELYEDLGSEEKVFIDIACASHEAVFESNHALLFEASLQWLRDGSVNGMKQGRIRLGE